MGKDLKARNANQGPMATVAVLAAVSTLKNAVAAMPVLVNPNPRARNPHYLQTSAGGVEKQDTRKGQICKALESICRNCRIKGHNEKVCMKKSAHLVNVPGNSGDSESLYYDELGEPVYAQTYAVQINGKNKNKHLIQLPVSVNLEKVRKPVESFPTILLKVDTGADVNLLNSTKFDQVIGNRSILQPSTLKMEMYGSSRVEVFGKFHAFMRWKGKIYRQPFFVTTANTSPNLLSRDACYTLGVMRPCYAVEAE